MRRSLVLLAALILLIPLLSVTALALVTQTAFGRRFAADRIERALDANIPGSVRIGELERLTLGQAVLRDLRFYHPNGTLVLRARHALLDVDPLDFARGDIELERARVDGGSLLITVDPDGRTSIEAVFDRKGESSGNLARIALRSMHVERFTLIVRPEPQQTFQLNDVEGFVGVSQHGPPGVQVRLDRITGRLAEPEILGERLRLVRADGWVHGGARQVIDLELHGALAHDRFDVHLAYYPHEEPRLLLELRPGGVKTELAALGAKLRGMFSETVDVRVD